MIDMLIGFSIGVSFTTVVAVFMRHRHTVKRTVKLEQERELLRIQVDAASNTIQRIIHEEKA